MDWKTFIPVVLSLLVILVPFIKAKIKELKFIQDRNFGEMTDRIIDWGVSHVEAWSKRQTNKPTSKEKLKRAVDKVKEYAAKRLPNDYLVEDEITARIESILRKHSE